MMNITTSTVHMITTQCLMSEHSSDSISNRLAQPGKNSSQKKYITRLEDHNNIDQLCDRSSRVLALQGTTTQQIRTHLLWRQDHNSDVPVHTQRTLHSFRTQTGETNIGSTQTKYNLRTSNSCKPMYHKLLLDHAREWH